MAGDSSFCKVDVCEPGGAVCTAQCYSELFLSSVKLISELFLSGVKLMLSLHDGAPAHIPTNTRS